MGKRKSIEPEWAKMYEGGRIEFFPAGFTRSDAEEEIRTWFPGAKLVRIIGVDHGPGKRKGA